MGFVTAALEVLIGTFILFSIARITYKPLTRKSGWFWVVFVAILAIANMGIHRYIGSTVTPPFYTATWFAITLAGLTPNDVPKLVPWHRRAIFAVASGTIVGWGFYVEIASI